MREWSQLKQLTDVLHPFTEATDLTQGDTMVTISYVVPTVLSLYSGLKKLEGRGGDYHCKPLVLALKDSLLKRFRGIFVNVR